MTNNKRIDKHTKNIDYILKNNQEKTVNINLVPTIKATSHTNTYVLMQIVTIKNNNSNQESHKQSLPPI